MYIRRFVPYLSSLLVIGLLVVLARADKWTPYEFKGPAFYKYRITMTERGETKEITYALDMQIATQEGGEPLYRVTTSTETLMKQEDIKASTVFGGSPMLALIPALMLGNPMFGAMIGQMELTVGEKMSFFGAGYAKVVARETVAGVEGFRCEIWIKKGDQEVKQGEITVHPDLPLPLRSRVLEDGNERFAMDLLEYQKH